MQTSSKKSAPSPTVRPAHRCQSAFRFPMRACCGQLAWVANHSRPDPAFLASYGVQDKAHHLALFNKAVREMKAGGVSLKFPCIPIERWRLLVVTDAG